LKIRSNWRYEASDIMKDLTGILILKITGKRHLGKHRATGVRLYKPCSRTPCHRCLSEIVVQITAAKAISDYEKDDFEAEISKCGKALRSQ
jgi:hypothetical protein